MDSESIYRLLQTKKYNQHYLARYWKFIQRCQDRELSEEYTEKHHILPKAKDMFPEFANITDHPWNEVELTAREHIIAHVILWKAYGGSQSLALDCMLGNFNSDTNSFLSERRIPASIKIRYLAKSREDSIRFKSEIRLGKTVFKDSDGNKFFLDVDDPMIKELNLVGNNQGLTHNESTKEKMKRSKDHSRRIDLWFLNIKRSVAALSVEYVEMIEQGWLPYKTPESYEYGKNSFSEKVSAKLKGTMRYMTPDGKFFARIPMDDPRIAEMGLFPQKTEKSVAVAKDNILKASQANIGRKTYNNGIVEKRFHSDPGGEWCLGRLPRIGEYRTKHASATSAAVKGTTTWNDGIRNYRVKPGEIPEENWVKGMVKQK